MMRSLVRLPFSAAKVRAYCYEKRAPGQIANRGERMLERIAARMETGPNLVRIGTRGSPLALAQAELAARLLAEASGGAIASRRVTFTTSGDRIQDRPLAEAGGKGLFTKELDRAQLDNEIDVAVHSLKDMSVALPSGLVIGAFLPREDPRDCPMGPAARLQDLPAGAVLGTSSLRRRAQALAVRPDLQVVLFRGNVQTRLRKLEAGEADATMLAAAGLRRLELEHLAAGHLEIEEMLPAGGQGIIAIMIRTDAPDWLQEACREIDDRPARLAAAAERAFLRRLDGSCRTAIAAHFALSDTDARMAGEILLDDGSRRWRAEKRLGGVDLSEQEADEMGDELGRIVAESRRADGFQPEPAS